MQGADTERVRDMVDAARKVVAFTQGKSRGDLDTDELLGLGIVRLLEIMGEAAKNVSVSMKDAHPNVPWQQVMRTRDRLIHGYSTVDLDIVWKIVCDDLPPLVSALEEMIREGA